jgi:hypothetical protein
MLFESVRGYRASGNFDILAEDLGTAEHSEAAIADKEVTRMRHLVFDLIIASNSSNLEGNFFPGGRSLVGIERSYTSVGVLDSSVNAKSAR